MLDCCAYRRRRMAAAVVVVAAWLGVTTAGGQEFEAAPADRALHPRIAVQTTLGEVVVELDGERAPITVANFVQYVEAGYYDGTLFHRVVKDGLIQGGGYTPDMNFKSEGLRPPIELEAGNGLHNQRGAVAMFRELRRPRSAAAQFFINVADHAEFDLLRDGAGYAVFGTVVSGMDVVDRIAATAVGSHPKFAMGCSEVVPVEPVVVKSARVASAFDREQMTTRAERAVSEAVRRDELTRMTEEERVASLVARYEAEFGAKFAMLPSGVRLLQVRKGVGAAPMLDDTVEIHYRLALPDGEEVETTYLREPVKRPMAGLTRGFREGLLQMQEGGRAKLIVPPGLAYGANGIPGRLPGDAWLVFDVELLSIE